MSPDSRVCGSLLFQGGSLRALPSEEGEVVRANVCESLGLNPSSQPFAMLRLNGKEILYPTGRDWTN